MKQSLNNLILLIFVYLSHNSMKDLPLIILMNVETLLFFCKPFPIKFIFLIKPSIIWVSKQFLTEFP